MAKPHYAFEHKDTPVIAKSEFFKRQLTFVFYAAMLLTTSLVIGMAGYHFLAGFDWTDSFYNAAMILTGMGPVDELPTGLAKYFAGTYALFSGIIFLSTVAILFAPLIHRLLHLMHIDTNDQT